MQFAEALLQAVIRQIPETLQLCNADSFGQLLSYYGNMNLGNIVQTNQNPDAHDRELASRLQQLEGGVSVKTNITFEGFGKGNQKEIDAISDHWLGEAMGAVPSTGKFTKEKREQSIRAMVIAKRTGRQVYFYFGHSANSEASAKIVEQLTRYAERIGITGIIEVAGNKQPLNYV